MNEPKYKGDNPRVVVTERKVTTLSEKRLAGEKHDGQCDQDLNRGNGYANEAKACGGKRYTMRECESGDRF